MFVSYSIPRIFGWLWTAQWATRWSAALHTDIKITLHSYYVFLLLVVKPIKVKHHVFNLDESRRELGIVGTLCQGVY